MQHASNVVELRPKDIDDELNRLVDQKMEDALELIANTDYATNDEYLEAREKAVEDGQRYFSYSYIALTVRKNLPGVLGIQIEHGTRFLDAYAEGKISLTEFERDFAELIPYGKQLIQDANLAIDRHRRNNFPELDYVECLRAGLAQMQKMFPYPAK